MACWFFVKDEHEIIEHKLNRFKNSFSVGNGFKLNVKPIRFDETKTLVLWSWNNLGKYPDIVHIYSEKDQVHLLIDGFISGFGKLGNANGNPTENADKLIQLYVDGEDFIGELNGSFCILLYDKRQDNLTFFNDRISSRPIWYNKEGQFFCAANFPSTIAAIKKEKPGISEIGLWSFLATGRHIGEIGLFEHVNNLPSGSQLTVRENAEMDRSRWFHLQYSPNYNLTPGEWGEKIAGELKDSAKRISQDYSDIYLFLSGGMDSRIAAASFGEGVNSITLTTRENMNSRISERVADTCGINHETVFRDAHWYLKSMEHAALIGSGNYRVSHAHFTSLFLRDEKYFNGAFTHGDLLENFNKHYFKIPVDDTNGRFWGKNFNKLYSYSISDFDAFENLFTGDYGKKIRSEWEDYTVLEFDRVKNVSAFNEDVADAYFRWQNTTVCPTYLMLENIRPFAGLVNLMFDNQLIQTLLSIPHQLKSKGKLHNSILRNIEPRLLWIPNSNYWLPPVAPEIVLKATTKVRPYLGKMRRRLVRGKKKDSALVLTEGSWDMLHERYRFDEAYKTEINKVVSNTRFIDFNPEYLSDLLASFHDGNINCTNEIEHIYSVNKLLSSIGY